MLRASGLFLISCIGCLGEGQTNLKLDEEIIFYPTVAQRLPGKEAWRVEIRGSVFEPDRRRLLIASLRDALNLKGVAMSSAERKVFDERARLFLVDHKRGRTVFVRYGAKVFAVGKSKADGSFSGAIELADAEVSKSPWITFEAVLSEGDRREFRAEALRLDKAGLSVISDIDDTIKTTEVRDRHAMLRNTFLREFTPVQGMAEFYQMLASSNQARFHYVSAGPWQLYEPLAELVKANGFPPGTFSLRKFRWKDRTFLSLFSSPEEYKPTVIEPFIKRFPQRRFILVGDSGERDPEIYAALARKYPGQIVAIYVRDVTGEPANARRYANTFSGLPAELWHVFETPDELKPFVERPMIRH